MASVGGVTCDIVKPKSPTGNKQRVETFTVPGRNGIGAQKLGLNDGEWEFTLVRFDTSANCDTWAAAIEALQSTVITIIDDWADTYTGMLMTGVSAPKKVTAIHAKALGATGVKSEITIKGRIT